MCHLETRARAKTRGWTAALACVLALQLWSHGAAADDSPNLLTKPFEFSLGSFILKSDTKVRVAGKVLDGDRLDWEKTFGGSDATRFRIDGYWRFADRHKVRVLWFNNTSSGSRTLERDIEWDDVIYPASAKIKGDFSFDIYELAYEYAFLRREEYELTGTFGVHYTDLALSLKGTASIGGQEPVSGSIKREASVGAPLPVLGLRGLWNLSHDFWLDASVQYFALSIDEYDGSITDYKAVVLWQPKKWVGLGAGYNAFAVDLDINTGDFKGSLDWTYKGPMIFYSVAF